MVDFAKYLTPGRMAQRIPGTLPRQIVTLCNRGVIPHEMHLGCRLISIDHIDLIRQACIDAGYLAPEPAAKSA